MVGVDELVDAATYEALAGVSKSDYEWRLRDEVGLCELGRRSLLDHSDNPPVITVDAVVLEDCDSQTCVGVRFRVDGSDHAFAWRRPIWPVPPPDDEFGDGTPEEYAGTFVRLFDEEVESRLWFWKDQAPGSDGKVWIGEEAAGPAREP
jgi:hypothetical protein